MEPCNARKACENSLALQYIRSARLLRKAYQQNQGETSTAARTLFRMKNPPPFFVRPSAASARRSCIRGVFKAPATSYPGHRSPPDARNDAFIFRQDGSLHVGVTLVRVQRAFESR